MVVRNGSGPRPSALDRGSGRGNRLHTGLVRRSVRRTLDRIHAGRMMQQFQALIAYVEDSGLADSIRENDALFPWIESIHVLAGCLVVGCILAVGLRLLGLASIRQPVSRVTQGVLPLTWCAFAVAL